MVLTPWTCSQIRGTYMLSNLLQELALARDPIVHADEEEQGVDLILVQLRGQRLRRLRRQIKQRDARALPGEERGDSAADAAARARYDGGLLF